MNADNERPTSVVVVGSSDLGPSAAPSAGENPALVYIMSLSQGSRRTMTQSLNVIVEIAGGDNIFTFPWGNLKYHHVMAIRAEIAGRYKPSTANKMLSALRQVIRTAWRLGLMSTEDMMRTVDIHAIRGASLGQAEAGRHITREEILKVLEICRSDDTIFGLRDYAIMRLYWFTGLRRSEMVGLMMDDVDLSVGNIHIVGKGRKERTVPLIDEATILSVREWISAAGIAGGHLFRRIWRSGRVSDGPITASGLFYILAVKRRKQAGVDPYTLHDIRRTFAGEMLDRGVSVPVVQKLMGHSNANTTAGYDRRGARVRRDAVRKMVLELDE